MRFTTYGAILAGLTQVAVGQDQGGISLSTALSNYTELSTFGQILTTFPQLLTQLVPQGQNLQITLLIPDNAAFEKFLKSTGTPATSLPVEQLLPVLQYHILAAKLTSQNFTNGDKKGAVVPTLLRERLYNNRSAGQALIDNFGEQAAQGNVLYISPDPIAKAKLRVRQSSPNVNVRGGLGATSVVRAVDGSFSGGSFHIIDTILSPPSPCSNTIRTLKESLMGLDNALNRSGLYPTLDTSPNVTCLAPNNDAFRQAGNPDASLNQTDLQGALLFHTLPLVTYSNYLRDGQVIQSVGGGNVTIRLVDNDIYFNDAKVLSPNVVTNNGLIHVLDRIMSANGTAPSGSGPSETSTGTGTSGQPTATGTSRPNVGNVVGANGALMGLAAFFAAALLF